MIAPRHILVTGSSGFVGQRLCDVLVERGYRTRAAVRKPASDACTGFRSAPLEQVVVGDIDHSTDWMKALSGLEAVVHLAGRAHVMHEQLADPLSAYRRVNVAGTLRLAEAAAESGVRRFIFVSSIKVNGESTSGTPFGAHDDPAPSDSYAISKWEAELGLRQIERDTGLEVVVVRPPLVYGPGVKGNFLSLLKWVHRGWPLPVGACRNLRSLIGLDNLVDLLVRCLSAASAAGRTFLVSDAHDLSTPELAQCLANALGIRSRQISVPPSFLKAAARLIGRKAIYNRLCGSLQIDISHTRQTLDWIPPVPIDDGLTQTARWFLQQRARV